MNSSHFILRVRCDIDHFLRSQIFLDTVLRDFVYRCRFPSQDSGCVDMIQGAAIEYPEDSLGCRVFGELDLEHDSECSLSMFGDTTWSFLLYLLAPP